MNCFLSAAHSSAEKSKLDKTDKKRTLNILKEVKVQCEKLHLNHSLEIIAQIQRDFHEEIEGFYPFHQDTATQLRLLWNTMQTEMSQRTFAYVSPEKDKYFEKNLLFGYDVETAFPSAKNDIRDAGNCIAADLNTAAVFHLVCVINIGLLALATHLKIKIKAAEYQEWGNIIGKLTTKLEQVQQKPKGKKKQEELEFYSGLLGELNGFKDVYRNNVAHARRRYGETEAINLFNRVGDFMRRLASRVSED
jgi:hypothetical protein